MSTTYKCPECGGTDLRTEVTTVVKLQGDTGVIIGTLLADLNLPAEGEGHTVCASEDCEYEDALRAFTV